MKPQRLGVTLCVLSACGFGAMAVFAKEAYAAGVDVLTLLPCRFLLAALAFWAVVVARGTRLPSTRALLSALLLGAVGYAAQAGLYFAALTRIDASMTSLLLYLYPVIVFVAAAALGRERMTPRRAGALGLASAGTLLVLAGGSMGAIDGPGVAMAAGAALVYAAYILVADRLVAAMDPFVLAAAVCSGAALSLLVAGLGAGQLHVGFAAAGWGWIAATALVSTVLGVTAFLIGLRIVGPATASIVSTAEPVVTVSLATALYGDALGPGGLLGGALVLAAVVVLQLRQGTVAADEPAPVAARPAPARALAHQSA